MLFFHAPNHRITSFRSCARASRSSASTDTQSNLPSVGSMSSQYTGASTVLRCMALQPRPMRLHVFRARGAGIAEFAAEHQEWRVVHDELHRVALFLQVRLGGHGSGGEQRHCECQENLHGRHFWLA